MGLNTAAPSYAAGQVVTAAQLNALQDGIQAAWTSYTPTLTGITIANGTIVAAYRQIGKTIEVQGLITAGTSTTYSGAFSVSLPVTAAAASTGQAIGACIAAPAGTRYACVAALATTTTMNFVVGAGGTVGAAAPAAWTATSANLLGFTVTYQAA